MAAIRTGQKGSANAQKILTGKRFAFRLRMIAKCRHSECKGWFRLGALVQSAKDDSDWEALVQSAKYGSEWAWLLYIFGLGAF